MKKVPCADCAARTLCAVGRIRAIHGDNLRLPIQERAFRKGEPLLEQGHHAGRMGFVKVGTTLAVRTDARGRRSTIAIFGRGQALGTFMLAGQPEAFSSTGASAGRLCEVDLMELLGQGRAEQQFHAELMRAHLRGYHRLADWACVPRLPSMSQRLLATVLLLAEDQGTRCVRLPSQTALAELLGTTRETVARSLRVLQEQKFLVRRDRWHCELTRSGDG